MKKSSKRLTRKLLAATMASTLALVGLDQSPALAELPGACLPPDYVPPDATYAICAEPATEYDEQGFIVPPRGEPKPPTMPSRTGPSIADPDPSAPDPQPLTDFDTPTPEPVEPPPSTPCSTTAFTNDRFVTCQYHLFTSFLFRLDNPTTPVGTGIIRVVTRTTRSPKSRDWTVEFLVTTIDTFQEAALANFRARLFITACYNCITVQTATDVRDIPKGVQVSYTYRLRSEGTALVKAAHQARIVLTHPRANVGQATSSLDTGLDTRCDTDPKIEGPGGCVYPNHTSTFRLPASNPDWNEVAVHILLAQVQLPLHYGLRGLGRPLTRITNDSWMKLNRRVACFTVVADYPRTSCDEYPFASTRQGAAFQGYDNTSREVVDNRDNSLAGKETSLFYSNYRILSGDGFWVDTTG
ncbi:MAG TPA: hypothetical protein VFC19_08655 [Candidatus Limnocylindrales bacterium]|nr:hypothetical protein [Candidatus Limnocylindrales bacterium]